MEGRDRSLTPRGLLIALIRRRRINGSVNMDLSSLRALRKENSVPYRFQMLLFLYDATFLYKRYQCNCGLKFSYLLTYVVTGTYAFFKFRLLWLITFSNLILICLVIDKKSVYILLYYIAGNMTLYNDQINSYILFKRN